ncbi:MAG: FAD-dependent monooxygenase [Alphaproteobacteria bacterium GM202ARS2]|nr:FAD-dependent monooxygenase [Alphaproteobacteria bacterium GM202ARS2]
MMDDRTQVIIVGGGLAGLGVAHALGGRGVSCVVLERGLMHGSSGAMPRGRDSDLRQTAVSYGSQQLMTSWGVWDEHLASAACKMTSICVQDGGDSAKTVFSAVEHGYERLGSIIAQSLLREGLARGLSRHSSVRVIEEAAIKTMTRGADGVEVVLEQGTVRGAVVVAADGRCSPIAQGASLGYYTYDYGQQAVVAVMAHEKPHEGLACELFLPQGTLALLPMADDEAGRHRSSLVWSLGHEAAQAMLACSDDIFAEQVAYYSESLFGPMSLVSKRQTFPLTLTRAGAYVGDRLALVGDACRSLHPLAGQGINLGWRDGEALAKVIHEAHTLGLDCGTQAILRRYEKARYADSLALMAATHGLNRLFAHRNPLSVAFRRCAVRMFAQVMPLQQKMMRYGMGMSA